MLFLRSTTMLRSAVLRPALSTAPRARAQVRYATQDYGSGDGNPAGENPQAQGKNSRSDLEHPGPAAPNVVKKNREQSQSAPQSQKSEESSSGSKASKSEASSGGNKGTTGAQPKILNANPPSGNEQDADVRQHNEEMDNRAEKAHQQIENKDAYKDKQPSKS
jgi:hypothetical protein